MADNTMIIVAVIAVLICICSSVSGVAFYMNQATPEETPETAGSPPPPAGSPPPPAGSPPPPAASGVTCKADGTWSNNSPVPPGTVITKSCPTGGSQTAKCKADGSWESDWQCSGASPAASGVTCKADGTWSNNSPVPPGTVITKACPSGGTQTAKCKADGDWESDWQCSGASPAAPNLFNGFGSATKLATATPEVNVKVGQAIGCITGNPKSDTRALYRYLGNKKISHYPNEEILNFWGSTGGDGPIKTMDCTGFTLGDDMMVPNSGDSVSCIGNEGYIQRYVGDKTIRGYPSEEIADSWNSNWRSNKVVDCSGLKAGPVMEKPKETPWNNCAVWDETTPGKHDDWCRNDFGSHAKHVGQGQHGCAKGWGKGVCKH